MTQSSWRLASTAAGKLADVPPAFTKDLQHLIVLTALELRVFSISSRQCIRSIPIEETENVVDLAVSQQDDTKIWIARKDGQLTILDWLEREIGETVDIDVPISRLLKVRDDGKAFTVVTESNHRHGFSIAERSMNSGDLRYLAHCKNGKLYAVSNNRQYYAYYTNHKNEEALHIGKIGSKEPKVFKRQHGLSSLAVSDDGVVAAGSVTGVIDLYYESFSESPAIRALKWHVDSVLSLCFSLENNYLISGGKERVLVFWQLDTDNTQFLPRLDGPIRNIVADPTSELYALTLGRDEVLVLSAVDLISRLQVSGIKSQFARLPQDPERERRRRKKLGESTEGPDVNTSIVGDYTSLFTVHPKTMSLYLPTSTTSQVQIYDIQRDQQAQVISVASNIQTGKVKSEELIDDANVVHIAFTKDGLWMATVDEIKTPQIDRLLSKDDKNVELKFWHFNTSTSKWSLATRVHSPHGPNKAVLDVIPTNNGHGFITASEDGGVRLWRPSPKTEGTVAWAVRKILPPTGTTSSAVSIALSPDSSVLLLGFETTIWAIDAKTFKHHRTLPNILGSRVRSLQFTSETLVAALSKNRLVIWDLINDCSAWAVIIPSPTNGRRLIAADVDNQRLAIAVNHYDANFCTVGKVFIFNAKSNMPVYIEHHPVAIAGVSRVLHTGNFIFMDVQGRVSTLTSGSSVLARASKESEALAHLQKIKLQRQRAQPEIEEQIEEEPVPEGQKKVLNINSFDNVFDSQSEYSLDSLTSLFDKVMGIASKV